MSTETSALLGSGIASYLAVPDISKSVQYYRDVLGFRVDMLDAGFALVSRDGATVMLQERVASKASFSRLAAYIWVRDIEQSHEKLTASEVKFTQQVCPTPWGTIEFQVEDPDGYQLRFAQIGAIE
ncbi:MAG TPA: glyoxalase superfamily protein [Capsulimonadaceae bacterium]|jgi:catechol 2,3-dioxygenase-like lactoylglutathione lyase family enzyme